MARLHGLVPLLGASMPALAAEADAAGGGLTAFAIGLVAVALAGFGAGAWWRRPRVEAAGEAVLPAPDARGLLELIAMASDWVWTTDADHRYTRIGEGLRNRPGLDPRALLGRRPWEQAWDECEPVDWLRYRTQVEQRDAVTLQITCKGSDGALHYLELIGRPLVRNGEFAGYQGIGRDLTEQVATERALQESQQRYFEVVEAVNEVIFRTDTQGRLSFINGVWRNITGYRVEQSLGKPLVDFFHPDDRGGASEQLLAVASGRLPECHFELRLRTREGEIRWIEAACRPITDAAGSRLGIAGTLDDISSRKVAELTLKNINQELEARVRMRTSELEASNRELEAFSYSVSHDLRAPLRAIDGFARILEEELEEKLDETARSHLDRIRKATQRMAHLIDALIELARLTRQSLHKETFDISELALQVVEELRAEEPEREVEVEITRGLIVTADRTLVRVLIENLLRNAWKFSSRQAVARIAFRAERERERRVFCVADNGAGFDMAFAANLFRPFHRLHNATEFSGTGIGLATVQRIIQRHGGVIWAQSKPGEGARFYFTLGS
ncbi:sensor histidine kinase [Azoarcus olearius]|uniref:histidine kinase n=1 Tax=Azoarcus sp. (strain BH72) TaxID=418699 RepID=A1K624_AZOSB|nr:PAS domain S-box protein [Azoarcus olearius]ANQ84850.1 putative two-component system sensor protein [Azoarcus olearius]CAL94279.1 putative two-component system sensor protein [Azoarcus olearius]